LSQVTKEEKYLEGDNGKSFLWVCFENDDVPSSLHRTTQKKGNLDIEGFELSAILLDEKEI